MDVSKLSKKYTVKELNKENAKEVYELELGNPIYFKYCPPAASVASVLEDMKALPPNTTYDDKLYVGFFLKEKLIAVMDLILHYPVEHAAFIGFFMMNKDFQKRGIGSKIINEVLCSLKDEGFILVKLGYMKENNQSKHFWIKNGFTPTGVETNNGQGIVVVMDKML